VAQVQICRGFGDKDWEELSKRLVRGNVIQGNENDWQRAVEIFERRMRERFFSSIDALEKISLQRYEVLGDEANPDRPLPDAGLTTPGFAIMALCCPLIDTLQFFRVGEAPLTQPQGCPRPEKCASAHPSTRQAFIAFLKECLSFSPDDAKAFADGIRNGIVHQAETRGWLIWRDGPRNKVVAKEGELFVLNRTLFCNELRKWFDNYLTRLRDSEKSGPRDQLRRKFVDGMGHVVRGCRKIK
jgi:hypothetical protein